MPLPTHSNLSKQGLHALQRIIVAAHCNVRQAEGRALDSALRAGEALLSAIERKLVRHNEKEDFYEQTCSSARTARDYIKLAENQALIDSYRQRAADMSIREALALIRKAKGTGKSEESSTERKNQPPPARSLEGWTDDEIRNELSKFEFQRFVRVIPDEFRPLLAQHAGGQILRVVAARHPKTKAKNLLQVVAGTDLAPLTTH